MRQLVQEKKCDEFLAANFREETGSCLLHPHAKRRFSYWVRQNGLRAFMIYVSQYIHDGYESFMAEAQFNIHGDVHQPVFNVVLLDAMEPEHVIGFFTRIWDKMECGFYDD